MSQMKKGNWRKTVNSKSDTALKIGFSRNNLLAVSQNGIEY